MEEYSDKKSLLESFSASAGGLQDQINATIAQLDTIIATRNPTLNAGQIVQVQTADQLVTFVNFYRAYQKFVIFIKDRNNRYRDFVRNIFPSHFQNRTARSSRTGKILSMLTPLTMFHNNIKNKKRFELTCLIYSAYYGPLVSILSQLNQPDIITKIDLMGMRNSILMTLETVRDDFTGHINISQLPTPEDDIRDLLNPENNLNDVKTVETLLNIISGQRYIDSNLLRIIGQLSTPPLSGGAQLTGPRRYHHATGVIIDNYEEIIDNNFYITDFINQIENPKRGERYKYTKDSLMSFLLSKFDNTDRSRDRSDNYRGRRGRSDNYRSRSDNYRDRSDNYRDRSDDYRSKRRNRIFEDDDDRERIYDRSPMRDRDRRRRDERGDSPESVSHWRNSDMNNIQHTNIDTRINDENRMQKTRYNLDLLIEYIASMVEYKVNESILDEELEEKQNELYETFIKLIQLNHTQKQEYLRFINSVLRDTPVTIDELDRLLKTCIDNHGNIDQELTMNGLAASFHSYSYGIPFGTPNNLLHYPRTTMAAPTSSSSGGLQFGSWVTGTTTPYSNQPLKYAPAAAAAAPAAANGSHAFGPWFKKGGKNIRSISKMYRKNNKKVKNVKKTRKIKKNKDKKQKTSKKMTKTSVQKKKSIKNKSIKNMKNTKNKKDNKSKTKKGRKN